MFFPWCAFFQFFLLFLRRLGEQENGESHYDGREPHGFAEECRSGTGSGLIIKPTEDQLPPWSSRVGMRQDK